MTNTTDVEWLSAIKFDEKGLIPVIAEDAVTHRNLMVAWMNKTSLQETVASGFAVYYSRSRQKLWRKGEESGHQQRVVEIQLDCDGDVITLRVEQHGGIACHTGRESCFYRSLVDGQWRDQEPVLKSPDEIYQK